MQKKKQRIIVEKLRDSLMKEWRKDCELIINELPDLIVKHQRIRDAAEERSHSGALRRAIHSSKILLHDLADRADTDMTTLDAFLTGTKPLTSDVIDRLTKILKLKLEPANGKPKPRRANAG